jgi:dTMP kinase
MAYQGWGQGADRTEISTLTRLLAFPPDLTLMLDVSVETSLKRLATRGEAADRYERLGADFFARLREGFLAIAAADPARCVVISAEANEDEVAAAAWKAVAERLISGATP